MERSVPHSVEARMFRDGLLRQTALQSGPARLSPTTNFTCLQSQALTLHGGDGDERDGAGSTLGRRSGSRHARLRRTITGMGIIG